MELVAEGTQSPNAVQSVGADAGAGSSVANAELLDSDLLRDAEATNQRPALVDYPADLPQSDELKTFTRLPPVTPPPPPMTTLMPPPMPASFRPPSLSPAMPFDGRVRHVPQEALPTGKPSWLAALLTSTLPPPSTTRDPSVRAPIRPATAGAVFAALGLVFAILALVTGLRGTPDESIAPAVAAALVIARALVTLGSGALSFVLMRSAERLLVEPGARE